MNRMTSPRPAYLTRLALFLLTALAALALLGFGARQAQATIYYVCTTGSNFNTGLTWAQAKSDLQATITAAHSGDQVWVCKGTYTNASNFTATDGVAVYGGFAGTETSINQRVFKNGVLVNMTILNYTSSSNIAIYTIPSSAIGANIFDGFTVENGQDSGLFDVSQNDTLAVANCTFTDNSAGYGGGIVDNSTTANITNCIFTDNSGGGLETDGSTTNIKDCTFTNNNADGGSGGGLEADGSTTNIEYCTFTSNSAGGGGGIYADGGIANITGCMFTNNNVDGGGGGIETEDTIINITDCTFINNNAQEYGGGVSADGMIANIKGCVFGGSKVSDSNTPDAISLFSAGNPNTTPVTPTVVKDCLIIGAGTTTTDSNGIDVDINNVDLGTSYITFANNTIVNVNVGINLATTSGTIKIANDIFSGDYGSLNTTGSPGPTFTSSHNDNYGNVSYYYRGLNPNSSDLSVNPSFFDAKDGDYHLSLGSPLLNAGDVSYVMTGDTDLDGHPRLINGKVDLGCYEGAELPTWKAVAVSAAPGGLSHILWNRSDGAAGIWTLNANGTETSTGTVYGPYTGWTAKAIATANDGTSRVLWTRSDGAAGIWTFNASGTETLIGPTYGPYTGWAAGAIAVAGDGTSRVLWTNVNGEAGVWSFGTNDAQTLVGPTYGPISGWGAVSISAASDGTSRLLWDRSDGAAGLWSLGTNDAVTRTGAVYGPYSGWTAKAVGTAGDGTSRVLWTNTNGDAGVWSFGVNDAETTIGTTYGPYTGWSAGALGVAYDGTSRVLWNNVSRAAGVWTVNASDVKTIIGPTYGPY